MAVAEKSTKPEDLAAEAKAKQEAEDLAELRRLREENQRLKAALPAAQPSAPAAPTATEWTIEVEAYNLGTYGAPDTLHAYLRQPGDRFKIRNEQAFAREWMQRIGDTSTPASSTVAGHGHQAVPAPGTPMTGVRNQVPEPVQILNDLAKRSAPALAR